jgi:long-chain fatty acid transport protein
MGRAGAFVAGGDDPGGIWHNPANIGGLRGVPVLVDGALVLFSSAYTRVDSGGNALPQIKNEGSFVPIPTLAASFPVLKERLWLGAAVSAPYAPILSYPRPSYAPCDPAAPAHCLDTVHTDAPQRYSLISEEGTTFIQLDLAVAVQLFPGLVVAASFENLFVSFASLNSITSYNGALSSGPEDPEFDSLAQMKLTKLFNPSAKVGVLYRPYPWLSAGLAVQLPFWIRGEAKVDVQLPTSPLYEKSTVEGNSAELGLTLPLGVRAGVEIRPLPELRVELGFDWDQWSTLQAIEVHPRDITIFNIPSIDRYQVPDLAIVLKLRDTFTVRLGGEYFFRRFPLVLRAGYIFERGAATDEYASVLAVDNDKHVVTLGAGYAISGYRVDLVFARSFSGVRRVDFRASQTRQVNPINPTGAVPVGGGAYDTAFTLLGLGVCKTF